MKRLPKNYFFDLDALHFAYEIADTEGRKIAFARIEEKLKITKAKPKAAQWDDYWKEMNAAQASSPSFFKKMETGPSIFRHNGGFIMTEKKDLAVEVLHQIIGNVLRRLPSSVTNIVEFGCGNGHNLEYIKKIFPKYALTGCDISEWAVKTVKEKGFMGFEFDMTAPSLHSAIPNEENTVYFTSGSMEQTGKKWKGFFKFIRQSKAKYVFHIEPIEELYSARSKAEVLALQFHHAKGYLTGYLSFLKEQRDFNVEYSKSDFGTLFDQGFNVILLIRK